MSTDIRIDTGISCADVAAAWDELIDKWINQLEKRDALHSTDLEECDVWQELWNARNRTRNCQCTENVSLAQLDAYFTGLLHLARGHDCPHPTMQPGQVVLDAANAEEWPKLAAIIQRIEDMRQAVSHSPIVIVIG